MIYTISSADCFSECEKEDWRYGANVQYAKKLKEAGYNVQVKQNHLYHADDEHYWPLILIELNSIEDVMRLPKILDHRVIIQEQNDKPENGEILDPIYCDILIYDDYLE